ncbi:MAG: hypothetical protein KKH98_01165, partial [Spirochaetes bacterium]|nr:hypothetical protein [Spirochaetota bacterium]
MNKKIIIFFLVVMIIALSTGDVYSDSFQRKDPILAGVLSWYMPGLGQFYAGKYLKGSIFWVVENTLLVSAILTIADINFS